MIKEFLDFFMQSNPQKLATLHQDLVLLILLHLIITKYISFRHLLYDLSIIYYVLLQETSRCVCLQKNCIQR